MTQAIPAYVINLDRRPDRLERIGAHLAERGVAFIRQSACDARSATEAEIAQVVRAHGPLGQLGLGDRACTVSHTRAWSAFLDSDATHALFLEDDIFLAADITDLLSDTAWIPPECNAVKLEKFNDGISRVLLAPEIGRTPLGRALHPMRSRHLGGGAYILTRDGARLALAHRGRYRVPIDHFLFNDTVSPIRVALNPAIIVPAVATQQAYTYSSDISPLGKAMNLTRMGKLRQKMLRGMSEINQFPRQLFQLATGQARLMDVRFSETPDQD